MFHMEQRLYGVNDPETLTHETEDDAIEAYLEEHIDPPTTLEVSAYERDEIDSGDLEGEVIEALGRILESLGERYSNPDDAYPGLTPPLLKAARLLADTIKMEFPVWTCSKVGEPTIVVTADWLKANGR